MPRKSLKAKAAPKAKAKSTQKVRVTREVIEDGSPVGYLEDLPSMPWDVVYEVLSNMNPIDLLSLARTIKEFRTLLMSKKSAFLWKAARRNVPGLPEPLPGLSEPAYAHLMFGKECQYCLMPKRTVEFDQFGLGRGCKKCRSWHQDEENRADTTELDRAGFNTWKVRYRELLRARIPGFEQLCVLRRWHRQPTPDSVHDFLKKWNTLSEERRKAYKEAFDKQQRVISQRAKECALWVHPYEVRQRIERKARDEVLRASRLQTIYQELKNLGYERDLALLTDDEKLDFQGIPGVRAASKLKKGWADKNTKCKLRSKLEDFLKQARSDRERRERESQLSERPESLARGLRLIYGHRLGRQLTPSEEKEFETDAAEIAALEGDDQPAEQTDKRRAMLLQVCLDLADPRRGPSPPRLDYIMYTPVSEMLHADPEEVFTYSDVMAMVEDYQVLWQPKIRDLFRDKVWEALGTSHVDRLCDPLELAVGQYWTCKNCPYLLEYPGVLSHQCPGLLDDVVSSPKAPQILCGPSVYQVSQLVSAADVISDILGALGLDTAATVEDADASTSRVLCEHWSDPRSEFVAVMTWRAAVAHRLVEAASREHRSFFWSAISYLSLEDPEEAELEAARAEQRARCLWYCTLCAEEGRGDGDRLYSGGDVLTHLETSHSIQGADSGSILLPWPHGDFFLHHRPVMVEFVDGDKPEAQAQIERSDED